MTEHEEDKKLSRRARRRAEQARARTGEDQQTERDGEGESGLEATASEDEPSERAEEGAEGNAPEARAEQEEPAKKPSKAERKRAKQEERSATAQIRDRNKRLREQAAQRRSSKRERARKAAAAKGLDASEMVDDALARGTHATTEFVRRHFNVIQWAIVLVIAGGVGWQIYSWRSAKTSAKASDQLMNGVDAELARVGDPGGDPEAALANPHPTYATEEERLQAAAKAYSDAENVNSGSGTAILATLGKAGVLYDQGKFDEAKAAYEQVRSSALAQHDADVRLRATEGVGLALEAKGDTDGALKAFQELERSDEPGFSALGLYHEARVAYTKGDKEKAKELIGKVTEKVAKDRSPNASNTYVERAARDLLAIIDPSTAPTTTSNYTPEQLEVLKNQLMKDPTKLKKMLEDMGKLKVPDLGVPMQEPAPGPAETGSPPPEAPPPTEPEPVPSGQP